MMQREGQSSRWMAGRPLAGEAGTLLPQAHNPALNSQHPRSLEFGIEMWDSSSMDLSIPSTSTAQARCHSKR